MFQEAELTYGIDVEIIDDPNGTFFLVYDAGEGFQPLTYAIQAYDAQTADEIWAEQERNRDTDTDQLVVAHLERS